MRLIKENEIDFISGGHFSVGGFFKSVGQGIISGVVGGGATGAIKDRSMAKTRWGAVAGVIGGGIVGGVTYIMHHH